MPIRRPQRDPQGYLPLEAYAALGDGRSGALTGWDGSIDWWRVPNMDSPLLFDRLLSPTEGGYFSITPTAFTWLINRLSEHGPHVCCTLDSGLASVAKFVDLPGYKHSPFGWVTTPLSSFSTGCMAISSKRRG